MKKKDGQIYEDVNEDVFWVIDASVASLVYHQIQGAGFKGWKERPWNIFAPIRIMFGGDG
jgi:hypothetical protein